jgi:hypothetical protein
VRRKSATRHVDWDYNLAIMLRYFVIAIAFIALGAPPQPGNHSVDWGSIHSFAGTYHAVTVQNGGNREEVSGHSKIPFSRSFPISGSVEYVFTGNSDATARTSGNSPSGPCAFQQRQPNHSGHDSAVRIDLSINLKNHTYSWQAQPIKIHFEEGGYSPDCGGAPRAMTAMDIGMASVGSLPLPTDTDVLCGKASFSNPGDFTANVDWYFYPDDGKPRQAPVCPAAVNPTGGTS